MKTYRVGYYIPDGRDREVRVGEGAGPTIEAARVDAARRRNEGRETPLDYPLEGEERVSGPDGESRTNGWVTLPMR